MEFDLDLGKVGLTSVDQWDSTTAYEKLTLVHYNGVSYVSRVDNTGVVPGTDAEVWFRIGITSASGDFMSVTSAAACAFGLSGGSEQVFITCPVDMEWSLGALPFWLSASSSQGTGSAVITLTCASYSGESDRTFVAYVNSEFPIKITQAGTSSSSGSGEAQDVDFTVKINGTATQVYNAQNGGANITIVVESTSSKEITFYTATDWFSILPSTTSSSRLVVIPANTNGDRTGLITITQGSISKTVTINQSAEAVVAPYIASITKTYFDAETDTSTLTVYDPNRQGYRLTASEGISFYGDITGYVGTMNIAFRVAANTTSQSIQHWITLWNASGDSELETRNDIIQSGLVSTWKLTPDTVTISPSRIDHKITITAPVDTEWTLRATDSITFSGQAEKTGTGSAVITYRPTVYNSSYTESILHTFYLYDSVGDLKATAIVTQNPSISGDGYNLQTSKVTYESGETGYIYVTAPADAAWTLSVSNYCKFVSNGTSAISGTGSSIVSFVGTNKTGQQLNPFVGLYASNKQLIVYNKSFRLNSEEVEPEERYKISPSEINVSAERKLGQELFVTAPVDYPWTLYTEDGTTNIIELGGNANTGYRYSGVGTGEPQSVVYSVVANTTENGRSVRLLLKDISTITVATATVYQPSAGSSSSPIFELAKTEFTAAQESTRAIVTDADNYGWFIEFDPGIIVDPAGSGTGNYEISGDVATGQTATGEGSAVVFYTVPANSGAERNFDLRLYESDTTLLDTKTITQDAYVATVPKFSAYQNRFSSEGGAAILHVNDPSNVGYTVSAASGITFSGESTYTSTGSEDIEYEVEENTAYEDVSRLVKLLETGSTNEYDRFVVTVTANEVDTPSLIDVIPVEFTVTGGAGNVDVKDEDNQGWVLVCGTNGIRFTGPTPGPTISQDGTKAYGTGTMEGIIFVVDQSTGESDRALFIRLYDSGYVDSDSSYLPVETVSLIQYGNTAEAYTLELPDPGPYSADAGQYTLYVRTPIDENWRLKINDSAAVYARFVSSGSTELTGYGTGLIQNVSFSLTANASSVQSRPIVITLYSTPSGGTEGRRLEVTGYQSSGTAQRPYFAGHAATPSEFPSTGGTGTITIVNPDNINWWIADDPTGYITFDRTSGGSEGTVTVGFTLDEIYETDDVEIVVDLQTAGMQIEDSLDIIQHGTGTGLDLSGPARVLPSSYGSDTVTVTAPVGVAWTLTKSGTDFITLDSSSGTGTGQPQSIGFTYTSYPSSDVSSTRRVSLTLTAEEISTSKGIVIQQRAGAEPVIYEDTLSGSIPAEGGTVSFMVLNDTETYFKIGLYENYNDLTTEVGTWDYDSSEDFPGASSGQWYTVTVPATSASRNMTVVLWGELGVLMYDDMQVNQLGPS